MRRLVILGVAVATFQVLLTFRLMRMILDDIDDAEAWLLTVELP